MREREGKSDSVYQTISGGRVCVYVCERERDSVWQTITGGRVCVCEREC